MRFMDFSRREIKDIIISVTALSIIFAYPEVIFQPLFFFISLLTVGIAFIGHELAHRYVARKRGFFSEYRMWPEGLFFALLLAFISNGSFIFAAPGAVVFSAYWVFRQPDIDDIGKIGIAGVVFNISLLYTSLMLFAITGFKLFLFMASINAWLAIFNLIPFGMLDGAKVMAWSKKAWGLAMVLAVAGFLIAGML